MGDYSVAHSKAVIVDGKWAYVGSANWSMPSMTSRREVGIAFEDQTLASALEEIFRTDWESEYASWVREPPIPLVQIFIHTVAILAAMSLIVAAILIKRRVKERRRRRKWIAELWASSRHEI